MTEKDASEPKITITYPCGCTVTKKLSDIPKKGFKVDYDPLLNDYMPDEDTPPLDTPR